jgi:hypothetical protein
MYLLHSCSLCRGADCEFVSPGDGMAAAVVTDFVALHQYYVPCLCVVLKKPIVP